MTGNNYLLDTNIIVAVLNDETALAEKISGETVYLSAIVIGELYYGAYRSGRPAENLARLGRFLQGYDPLNCNLASADFYGQIKAELKRLGQPIPENDIWIAATALQHNLTLVTRDKHFEAIKALKSLRW